MEWFASKTAAGALAFEAYVESAVKAVAATAVSLEAGQRSEVILSGRLTSAAAVRDEVTRRLTGRAAVHLLSGFAPTAKHAAQGAALIADGLAGGSSAPIVEALGIREARGTILDHLHVISAATAGSRLGIES